MAVGVFLIPILFIVGILLLAIIPVVVALIYRGSYTRHLNESMADGTMAKRWLSPFALGLIIFLVEVILMVGITVIGVINYRAILSTDTSVSTDLSENYSTTYTEKDVPAEYAIFNGSEVEGFDMTEQRTGNFHYYVYKNNENPSSSGGMDKADKEADFVMMIEYTGDIKANSAFSNLTFDDKSGGSAMGVMNDASDRYYAVIDTGNCIYRTITNKDGQVIMEDKTLSPKDIDIYYELTLLNLPDGENLDLNSLMQDEMIDSFKVNLWDIEF